MRTMLYFTCELADISYIEQQKAVKISWKQNFEDANKYFLIQSKAFVLLKQQNCQYWISDLRNKQQLSFEETEWLRRFMLPQAIENKVKKVAFILRPEDAEALRVKAIKEVVGNSINLRFFHNEETANEWLSKADLVAV